MPKQHRPKSNSQGDRNRAVFYLFYRVYRVLSSLVCEAGPARQQFVQVIKTLREP
ncbi:hypothetical protein [Thermoleptolyngbya sp.]